MREIYPDGRAMYRTEYSGRVYTLLADPRGQPVEYKYSSNKGWNQYVFEAGNVILTWQSKGKPEEQRIYKPSLGILPDFNARPDPYLIQHLLIGAYDFVAGGKQTLRVYDTDTTGTNIEEYEITLELVDGEGVLLPNGKFKAKHLAQVQQTGGGTWYKKGPGSQTDI